MYFMKTLLFAICLFSCALTSHATDPSAEHRIAQWYDALERADATVFDQLLADDAVIVLEDLGIKQTKAEFIDALASFADALGDQGNIDFKLEKSEGNESTVIACYRFSSNRLLVRETFQFADQQVTHNLQTGIGEDCTGM